MKRNRLLLRILLALVLTGEVFVFFSKPKINISEREFPVSEPMIDPRPDKIIQIISSLVQEKEEEPPLVSRLELLGTAIGNIKDPIAYIKDLESGKQGIYRTNDRIREAKIIRISVGEVLLDINGSKEALRLSKRGRSWAKISTGPAITLASADNFIVSKSGLSNELDSIEETLRTVKVKPFRESNKVTGLIVEGIGEDSIVSQAGIRNKDIVTSVNNQKMDSYQKALQVFAKAVYQPEIKVKLLREGQPKSLSYRFEK